MNVERKDILLVLPALNEEEALKKLATEIPSEYDVLVVDSMSTDKTVEVARRAGFACVEAKHGVGQGSGIRTGFEYFLEHDYSHLLLMDCDYTDDPKDLPRVLSKLKDGGFDVVLGIRDMGKQRKYLGVVTIVVKEIVSLMILLLMGEMIRDMLTGMWAFNRKALEKITPRLRETGFEWGFELVYTSWFVGLRSGEEDVDFRPRVGKTKLSLRGRFIQVIYGIKYGLKVVEARVSGQRRVSARSGA